MPELEILIGGRSFEVACQEGEEHYLQAAADMLNTEASALIAQTGRIPEARMLLMSGLMLADRTAGVEDRLARQCVEHGGLAHADAPERGDVQLLLLQLVEQRLDLRVVGAQRVAHRGGDAAIG